MNRLVILYVQALLLFVAGLLSLYISIFARKEWVWLKRTKWLSYLVTFSWFICPFYYAGRIFCELPAGNPVALILTLVGAASLFPSFIVWFFFTKHHPIIEEQKSFTSQYIRKVVLATFFMLFSDLFLGYVLAFWEKPYFWFGALIGVFASIISTLFLILTIKKHEDVCSTTKTN